MKKILSIAFIAMFALCGAAPAGQVTLQWTANPDPAVGYRLYARTGEAYDYTKPVWQGSTTTATVEVPDDVETAFVVRAYLQGQLTGEIVQSADSNEVVSPVAAPSAPKDLILQALERFSQGLDLIKQAIGH